MLQLVDFADEGGGAYYRDLAVNTIRLACDTPDGPPRSSAELLARLHRERACSRSTRKARSRVAEIARPAEANSWTGSAPATPPSSPPSAAPSTAASASTRLDTAYFLLDGLRLKYEAGYLARFLVEEFTQWAVGRKATRRSASC